MRWWGRIWILVFLDGSLIFEMRKGPLEAELPVPIKAGTSAYSIELGGSRDLHLDEWSIGLLDSSMSATVASRPS